MKYLIILLFFISCLDVNCDNSAEAHRPSEYLIIVGEMPDSTSLHIFNIEGFDPFRAKKLNTVKKIDGFASFIQKLKKDIQLSSEKIS